MHVPLKGGLILATLLNLKQRGWVYSVTQTKANMSAHIIGQRRDEILIGYTFEDTSVLIAIFIQNRQKKMATCTTVTICSLQSLEWSL